MMLLSPTTVIALRGLSMLKVIVLVPLLILLGSAQGNRNTDPAPAQVRCPRAPASGLSLLFKVKKPADEHGPATREVLRKELPCLVFECTRKGDLLVTISRRDANRLLGRHVVYNVVTGAGNNVDTDALFVDVRPASFVPEILKEHVERLTFHDDPKLDYTGPATKKCE
jgi:hypothetical protein